jgi:hypothetical protein
MPEFTEPFYGCRICGDPNNHSNRFHSEALGCSCTREERDPKCLWSRFNAEAIASEAHAKGEDPERALVFQSVGAASSCWEHLEGAGVFDDRMAKHVGDQLLAWFQARTGANLGLATTGQLLDEVGTRIEIDYYSGGGGLDYTTVGGRPPGGIPKTPDEKREFSRDWDRRYAEGQGRVRGQHAHLLPGGAGAKPGSYDDEAPE